MWKRSLSQAFFPLTALLLLSAGPAPAADYPVTTTTATGAGSLTTAASNVNASPDPDNTMSFGTAGTIKLVTAATHTISLVKPASLLTTSSGPVTISLANGTKFCTTDTLSLGGQSTLTLSSGFDTAEGLAADGNNFLITGGSVTGGILSLGSLAIDTIGSNVQLKGISQSDGETWNALYGTAVSISSGFFGTIALDGTTGTGTLDENLTLVGIAARDADIAIQGGLAGTTNLTATGNDNTSEGLLAAGNIFITGGLSGTIAAATGDDGIASGLHADGGNITVTGGLSGTVAATSGDGGLAVGLDASDSLVIAGGLSGTVTATTGANNNAAMALVAENGDLTVSGGISGAVAATAGAGGKAIAIDAASGNIAITGGLSGSVTGQAGNFSSAGGIFTDVGDLSIAGGLSGTVAATSGRIGYSIGIGSSGNLSLSGGISGTIAATAGAGGVAFALVSNEALTLTGGISASGLVAATAGDGGLALGVSSVEAATIAGGIAGSVTAQAGAGGTALALTAGYLCAGGPATLNGGDADTPLSISGTIAAQAGGLAVAVSAKDAMSLHVTGTLSGVDTSGGGNGYAIRAGYSDGTDWVAGSADNIVILDTGARLIGKVDLGSGNNTLKLYGTGSADNLFLGVTNLVVGDGTSAASWTLNPPAANASTYGGLTINPNAALSINENVTIAGNITDNGALTFDLGADKTYGGVISGSGTVTKTGSGTLTLSGANTYTGATYVTTGILRAGAANTFSPFSAATVASGALLDCNNYDQTLAGLSGNGTVTLGTANLTLDMPQGADATFSGVLSGTGALIKTGAGAQTLTGANTYSGGTRINGGTLTATDASLGDPSGDIAFGGGTLRAGGAFTTSRAVTVTPGGGTFDNGGNPVTLAGTFTGTGDCTFTGSATTIFSGNGSSYTGTATVSAGTLHVASGGILGGALAVAGPATLGGYGTVGNLVMAGTLTPGGSIGTLAVSGDYTQNASATYVCELSPGQGDQLAVAGTATLLGGTLTVEAQKTFYPTGATWAALTATGGVTGTFSSVTQNLASQTLLFLPVTTQAGVSVTTYRLPYATYADSASARGVAASLNLAAYSATGEMAALLYSLDYAPSPVTSATLGVLSPEPYDAFTQSILDAGRLLTVAQHSGLHEEDGEGTGNPAFANPLDAGPGTLLALDALQNGPPAFAGPGVAGLGSSLPGSRFGLFLRPFGMLAQQGGEAARTGYKTATGGITGGILYRPGPDLTLGLAPGYLSQAVTLKTAAGGYGTARDWSLALLARYRRGNWYGDASIRVGINAFTSSRTLPLPTGTYTAWGKWNGWNTSLSLGGGYDFQAGGFTFGPMASAQWQGLAQDSFTETGACSLGQRIGKRRDGALSTTLGGRVARTFETGFGTVTPELRAAWGAQWLGDARTIPSSFAGYEATGATTQTARHRYHCAILDGAVTMRLRNSLSATARVEVELFRPGYDSQAASIGLRYTF